MRLLRSIAPDTSGCPAGFDWFFTVVGTSTIVTPEGKLYLEFHGTFVLNGTPPVAYHTDATTPYTVTGGTGIFAGASGHGRIDVSDDHPG